MIIILYLWVLLIETSFGAMPGFNSGGQPPDPGIIQSQSPQATNLNPGGNDFVSSGNPQARIPNAPQQFAQPPISAPMMPQQPPPGINTRFLPSQGPSRMGPDQDFGGGDPFSNQDQPPPDYGNMGDYDSGDGAGPSFASDRGSPTAGPLSPYLTPLRRFFNPMTGHHFVHSDAGVMMRNIGGIGEVTHKIIAMPRYNRNQDLIDSICPYLVRLHSIMMDGAQLLISNPIQHQQGKMSGWTDTKAAGMCSRVQGACGATLPLVAARRTNMEPDFIHFVTRIEMNQYLMTHRNFVPTGRGVICWVWP